MIGAALVCIMSLSTITEGKSPSYSRKYWRRHHPASLQLCVRTYREAEARGLDPLELVAVGWVESRHRNIINSIGASGPLQAIPKYWCRGPRVERPCDFVKAGARAWAHYRGRTQTLEEAAGEYSGAGPVSDYALAVRAHHDLLREKVDQLPLIIRWGAYGR